MWHWLSQQIDKWWTFGWTMFIEHRTKLETLQWRALTADLPEFAMVSWIKRESIIGKFYLAIHWIVSRPDESLYDRQPDVHLLQISLLGSLWHLSNRALSLKEVLSCLKTVRPSEFPKGAALRCHFLFEIVWHLPFARLILKLWFTVDVYIVLHVFSLRVWLWPPEIRRSSPEIL